MVCDLLRGQVDQMTLAPCETFDMYSLDTMEQTLSHLCQVFSEQSAAYPLKDDQMDELAITYLKYCYSTTAGTGNLNILTQKKCGGKRTRYSDEKFWIENGVYKVRVPAHLLHKFEDVCDPGCPVFSVNDEGVRCLIISETSIDFEQTETTYAGQLHRLSYMTSSSIVADKLK